MGEILDWLIELAENADNEDSEQIREEFTETHTGQQTEALPESPPSYVPESGFLEEPVTLMDELRSQVEPLPEEELKSEPTKELPGKPVRFAGMVPWQLAILSIMLFLDIAIIGLLFLTMLGRIALP